MQEIASVKNAKIKYLFQLYHKSALRKKQKEFLFEGISEVEMAIRNNIDITSIFIYPDLFKMDLLNNWKKKYGVNAETILISKPVYEKLAYRKTTGGILVLAKMRKHDLNNIKLNDNTALLIAEQIEKPGNLGAMLRTTDAAGFDAFILVNPKVDLYNPNVVRASLGTIFSNQIVIANIEELKTFLGINNILLFEATLQNSNPYFIEDYTKSIAIAVGSEDRGLTDDFRKISHKPVYIPMKGQADSLNVSVSAAILSYEVLKQRNSYEK